MSQAPPLAGLRVLVTRPADQAEALSQLLEARGAEVRRLPLLAIEPARGAPALLKLFDQARDFNGWIFTSRNAVDFTRQLAPDAWPSRLYAVGSATASALDALGLHAEIPPGSFSGEGLLQHAELQQVQGRRYLLVTGAGGLGSIAEGLSARGANVEIAEVYRRVPLPHAPEAVAAAVAEVQAIVCTSGEGLDQLWRLTPEPARARLLRCQLALPSARVVEKALDYGFQPPLVPDQVSDAAYARCLELWWARTSSDAHD